MGGRYVVLMTNQRPLNPRPLISVLVAFMKSVVNRPNSGFDSRPDPRNSCRLYRREISSTIILF